MFFLYLKKKIVGHKNNKITIELKAYVPVMESSWINSKWFTKLKAIKFQGKPPITKLLKYSKIDNEVANIKIDKKFFSGFKNEKAKDDNP